MYLNNKYTIWYYRIIDRGLTRELPTVYTEKHHIIPTSLGGSKSKKNIVVLTAREHFLCHLLLTKMVEGNYQFKMIKALTMIMGVKNIGKGRYIANSKWYQYARENNKKNIDIFWTADRRLEHSRVLKEYNLTLDKTSQKEVDRRTKISEFQKTKEWSDLALITRTENMKKSADHRRNKPWPGKRRTACEECPVTMSEESNEKRRQKLKGRKTSTGTTGRIVNSDKSIYVWMKSSQNEEILFGPISYSCKIYGLNGASIKKVCNGICSQHKGWGFMRVATDLEKQERILWLQTSGLMTTRSKAKNKKRGT